MRSGWRNGRAANHRRLDHVTIAVFAGNHGVAVRGVSAYPPTVTEQMVANFSAGGAAINQIAKLASADLRVMPIELARPTRDLTVAAAMEADEFLAAVDIGYRAVPEDCDLLAVGEMGIANTTAAAALCAALLGGGAGRWAGRGTGVDEEGLARKQAAIDAALVFHRGILGDPLVLAAALGGRELAAIAGAVLAARRHQFRCCSTASSRHPPCCRWRASLRQRSITAAPGTSPPRAAIASCCANSA